MCRTMGVASNWVWQFILCVWLAQQSFHPAMEGEPPEESVFGGAQFTDKEEEDAAEREKQNPVEYFCGFGPFRPKCLQVFRSAKFFTFLLCTNCIVEGALVTGFVSVVLSSVEVRYQLTSTKSGLIPSVFDMAVLVSVVFVSYFAGKGHKPRWLGVCLLIQGLGALIFALPQFVFGSYANSKAFNQSSSVLEECNDVRNFTVDCEVTGRNQYALVFFYIGNIVMGIGASPLFTIGPSCIDDFVHPKYVSIHLGFFFMCSILGPALGFGLGAAFLSVYVDFWEETRLDPSDPAWVGAWWLCFLLAAVISWIQSIPFLMFPKLLPDSHLVKAEREKEMAQKYSKKDKADIESTENKNFFTKLLSFHLHLWQVVTTPSWIFITIGVCFSAFAIEGLATFGPKYYETQFSVTASVASVITGATIIPAGAVAVMVSAFIIYCVKSKGRSVAMVNWIITIIATPPLLFLLIRCPTLELAGVNVPFADGSILSGNVGPTESMCNRNCSCTSTIFEPVCGSDDLTYFSPCFAGCQKGYINGDIERPIFENCSCVAASLDMAESMPTDLLTGEEILVNSTATATEGVCDNGCSNFGAFVGVSAISLFLVFLLEVPNIFITLRCVAEEQRSLALGVQSLAFRILGNVPGPIVFGAVFDAACIYFRYDSHCMSRGNCWVYNNFQLSWSILTIVLIAILFNMVVSFFTWLVYPKEKLSSKPALTNKTVLEMTTEKT